MPDIKRFYRCGCSPDDGFLCARGESWKHKEYVAAMDRVPLADYAIPVKELERAAFQEGLHRGQLSEHFRLQDELGLYKDVDLDAPENQPPDDGYDEDPKVVGY